jgi:hypothetical protein
MKKPFVDKHFYHSLRSLDETTTYHRPSPILHCFGSCYIVSYQSGHLKFIQTLHFPGPHTFDMTRPHFQPGLHFFVSDHNKKITKILRPLVRWSTTLWIISVPIPPYSSFAINWLDACSACLQKLSFYRVSSHPRILPSDVKKTWITKKTFLTVFELMLSWLMPASLPRR